MSKRFWLVETMFKLQENDIFYCQHLFDTTDRNKIINDFIIKEKIGSGLLHYLKKYAVNEEITGSARIKPNYDKDCIFMYLKIDNNQS